MRRKSLIILPALGLFAAAATMVVRARYQTGSAQVISVGEHNDKYITVELEGTTFLASANWHEVVQAAKKAGRPVAYKVDTWRHRDVLPIGVIVNDEPVTDATATAGHDVR